MSVVRQVVPLKRKATDDVAGDDAADDDASRAESDDGEANFPTATELMNEVIPCMISCDGMMTR